MDSIAYPDRKHALQIAKQPLGGSVRRKPLAGSFNRGGGCEKPTNEFEWQADATARKKSCQYDLLPHYVLKLR